VGARTPGVQTGAPPPQRGVISGRVTTTGGQPVVRARVLIARATPTQEPCAKSSSTSTEMLACNRIGLTDSDGRYTIKDLPAETPFVVTVSKTGYAPIGYGEVAPAVPPTPIELHVDPPDQADQKGPRKDNVDIVMVKEIVVTGRVLDEDGSALAGALVQAQRTEPGDGNPTLATVSDTTTDDRGEFRLTGLSPGRYYIDASDTTFDNVADARGSLVYPPTYYPGKPSLAEATPITLTAGQGTKSGIEIKLQLAPLPRQAGGISAGRVLSWLGGGWLILASLLLMASASRAPHAARRRPILWLAMTIGLVAVLAARTPPLAQTPSVTQKPPQTQKPPKNPKGQVPETAAPKPAPQPARGVIAGRVTSLIDGQPIERVRLVVSALPDVLKQNRIALTDKDGRYSVPDLPVGQGFVVTASKTGYAPRAFGETPPAVPPQAVDLLLDQRFTADIELVREVVVTGRILDEKTGEPLAGALVDAQRTVFQDGMRTPVTVAESLTNDLGAYRLYGLPPGRYYVSAFDPAFASVGDPEGPLFYSPTFYPGGVVMDDATPILLDPDKPDTEAIEFRLKIVRPARVRGRIATSSAEPLHAGNVIMSPQRSDQISSLTTIFTNLKVDNTFEFDNIQPDRYRIIVRGETTEKGVTWFQQYSQLVEGIDNSVGTLTMSQGAVVIGSVKWDAHGHTPPIDRAIRIRAPMADGSAFGDTPAKISPSGAFVINGIMNGLHYLRVQNLPEPWHLKAVYLRGGNITDIAYDFHYEETLTGIVIEITDNNPDIRGTLSVTRRDVLPTYVILAFPAGPLLWYPGSRHVRIVRPDNSGRYRITGLPPAEYIVVATRDADEGDEDNAKLLDRLSSASGAVRGIRLVEGAPPTQVNLRGALIRR
jgi:protocatechuate 3,4-dioxygenase beta subunit